MIEYLATPAVCVVDDEPRDYEPILAALNSLHVSAVHIKGDLPSLPEKPFTSLRLVFLDLHLVGTVGKDAASHTANAFRNIVSVETAPIIVVIWSKYAGNLIAEPGFPPNDQETESELFKRTLLEAEPGYEGRLIFVEMAKPKPVDRRGDWTKKLRAEIAKSLKGQPAIEALWAWNSMVQDSCIKVSSELTTVTQAAVNGKGQSLSDGLKNAMQSLVQAQGKGDITDSTAPVHLTGVLSNLLSDRLEHPDNGTLIAYHGKWLSKPPTAPLGKDFSAHMSTFLMATAVGNTKALYIPGTVYSLSNKGFFKKAFGVTLSSLVNICCDLDPSKQKWADWNAAVKPVVVEISPACDVAQGKRVNATLVAGLVVPTNVVKFAKRADFIVTTCPIKVHWGTDEWVSQNAILLLCHLYKFTVPQSSRSRSLKPWFRLRELPASAIRNSNAAHAARVGYVSVV